LGLSCGGCPDRPPGWDSTGQVVEAHEAGLDAGPVDRLITDEGVAAGGAINGDTATGVIPVADRVAGVLAFRRS